MGELVNLEEYKKQKQKEQEQKELEKLQEDLKWLKEKLEKTIEHKYVPIFPQEEYYQWHPPHLISYPYHEYETDSSWDNPHTYELIIDNEFDWEKS
jgi:hypothetical protein